MTSPVPAKVPFDQPLEPPKLPDRPEFEHPAKTNNKHKVVQVFALLILLAIIAVLGTYGYRHYHDKNVTTAATTTSTKQVAAVDPYAGWKTYASTEEQSSFRYPDNWKITTPYQGSLNGDQLGIVSPSGAIKISWSSELGGYGNEYGTDYPLHTIVDKTPITGAPGLYEVSGITTLDGTTYHPWIAVQDSQGVLTNGVHGDVLAFRGRHAINPTTNDFTDEQFATSGLRADQYTPALTKVQATTWFSSTEARQAKLILLSFTDTPATIQYLNVKEWGIKLPLSDVIKNAYYVVSNGSADANGQPNTMWLGLTSLNIGDCNASLANKSGGPITGFGALERVLPTDHEPVIGKLYTDLYPGVLIGKYYYAYISDTKYRTCTVQAILQPIDSAFATAAKGIVAAQTTTQYLDIKEWGVHLTLNSTTASLYYYIKPDLPNVAYVSLKSISDVAPNCAADKVSLGAIVRQTPAEQQSAPDAKYSIKGTIHIGNYWYGYDNSHAACTDGTTAMNAAVSKVAPNYNPGVLLDTLNTLAAD